MTHPATVRVDGEGRLVIPDEVRQELGIEPGESFLFEREGTVLR